MTNVFNHPTANNAIEVMEEAKERAQREGATACLIVYLDKDKNQVIMCSKAFMEDKSYMALALQAWIHSKFDFREAKD